MLLIDSAMSHCYISVRNSHACTITSASGDR